MPTTERLTLRSWRPSDRVPFARLNADPEVVRFLNDGVPFTQAQSDELLDAILAHWEQRGFGLWCAAAREDPDECLGFVPVHLSPSGAARHLPMNGEEPSSYPFFLALTAAVRAGRIFSASPTTPRSAIFMIGASASLLIAMMILDVFMPTVCCMAPEMPTAM